MEVFAWSDKYSVGIMQIDMQHKQLFAMVNKVHEAMAMGKGNEAMESVLSSLCFIQRHISPQKKSSCRLKITLNIWSIKEHMTLSAYRRASCLLK